MTFQYGAPAADSGYYYDTGDLSAGVSPGSVTTLGGVASGVTFGSMTVASGGLIAGIGGIASGVTFGSMLVTSAIVIPPGAITFLGIPSAVTFGDIIVEALGVFPTKVSPNRLIPYGSETPSNWVKREGETLDFGVDFSDDLLAEGDEGESMTIVLTPGLRKAAQSLITPGICAVLLAGGTSGLGSVTFFLRTKQGRVYEHTAVLYINA